MAWTEIDEKDKGSVLASEESMNSVTIVMQTWHHGMRQLEGWPPGVIALTLPVYHDPSHDQQDKPGDFASIEFRLQHAVRRVDDGWWLMEEVVGDGVCVHARKVREV